MQEQSVRVLVRVEAHVPKREEVGREQYHDRDEDQNAALQRQRQLEERCFLVKKITHIKPLNESRDDDSSSFIPHPSSLHSLLRLDQQVPLHLLVERRAEVGAVIRKDAGLVCDEFDSLHLTRINHNVEVVFTKSETVQFIGRLLDVGQVDGHMV